MTIKIDPRIISVKTGKAIALAFALFTIAVSSVSIASAQDARYLNKRYGISFQPPPGWVEDKSVSSSVLVQYLGPKREDNTRPVINLTAQEGAINLDEDQVKAIESELSEGFEDRGLTSARVIARKEFEVSGFDALQMDLTYRQGETALQSRQVYLPIREHKRTYLFTFSDDARHFDESSAAAESAVNSFVAQVSEPAGTSDETGESTASHTLFLILIGLVALAIVIGAGYLLLRGRHIRSSGQVR